VSVYEFGPLKMYVRNSASEDGDINTAILSTHRTKKSRSTNSLTFIRIVWFLETFLTGQYCISNTINTIQGWMTSRGHRLSRTLKKW